METAKQVSLYTSDFQMLGMESMEFGTKSVRKFEGKWKKVIHTRRNLSIDERGKCYL